MLLATGKYCKGRKKIGQGIAFRVSKIVVVSGGDVEGILGMSDLPGEQKCIWNLMVRVLWCDSKLFIWNDPGPAISSWSSHAPCLVIIVIHLWIWLLNGFQIWNAPDILSLLIPMYS